MTLKGSHTNSPECNSGKRRAGKNHYGVVAQNKNRAIFGCKLGETMLKFNYSVVADGVYGCPRITFGAIEVAPLRGFVAHN